MASPLPLLAIAAAAFFFLKKKGSRDNVYVVTDTNALPILQSPYIQVSSSYAAVATSDIEDVVRPIAKANTDIGFIIAAGAGADRLSMAQLGVEMAPEVFAITYRATQEVGPLTKGMGGPDATLTDLKNLVNEAVAAVIAPQSGTASSRRQRRLSI